MTLLRRVSEFVYELPPGEGPVSIGTFGAFIVTASKNGPARLISQRPDGSYQIEVLDAGMAQP